MTLPLSSVEQPPEDEPDYGPQPCPFCMEDPCRCDEDEDE